MLSTIQAATIRLLRWSEQYTKADMVYLTKGSFWVTLGRIGTNLISIVLVFIYANLLPKETYGLFQYALAIIGTLNIFTLTGMNSAVSQAVASGKEGVLRASVRYQLKWNMLMFGAAGILGIYYFFMGNLHLAGALFLLGLSVPITNAFSTYTAFLDGKKAFRLNSLFGIGATALYVICMSTAVILSGEFIWLIIAYASASLAASILFYAITLQHFQPVESEASSAITYGWKLTGIGVMTPLVSQLDKVILANFWGATELAVYSLATVIPNRATTSLKSLMSVGFPKFAMRTPEEINKVFFRRIFQGMVIGLFCAVAYILISPYLFFYLLPKYLDSIAYSQILAISFIFALPNRYISLLLESQKFSKKIFINSTIQNLLRIACYIFFGIWSGIFGLVVAHVLLSFIGMLINIYIWRFEKKL